jgi:hypothetical protein
LNSNLRRDPLVPQRTITLNAKKNDFWKDKITPEKLLRRRNEKGEAIDRIGEFIGASNEVKFKVIGGSND